MSKELEKKQRECCSGGKTNNRFNVMYVCEKYWGLEKGVLRRCRNCNHMKNNGSIYCDLGMQ